MKTKSTFFPKTLVITLAITTILAIIPAKKLIGSQWFLEDDWSLKHYYEFQAHYEKLMAQKKLNTLLADTTARNYDVLRYDIYLDWHDIMLADSTEKDKLNWQGRNNITLQVTADDLPYIELDAIDLQFTQIVLNGIILAETPQITNNILQVPLISSKAGDIITLDIEYTYEHSDFKSTAPNKGFGFYLGYKGQLVDAARNFRIEEQVAYTVNSPQYARYWLPCNDRPRDKALVSMSITVPDKFTAASNGRLEEVQKISAETGEVKQIFKWSDDVPIATYLINATASIYKQYSDKFKSPNIIDSIENWYYIWETDTNSTSFKATDRLKNTTRILEYFSNKFTDYPFCKYGQIAVYPFNYGAMENQTLTTLGRFLFSPSLINSDGCEATIAHEIAHQWFGDLVTAISWDDIWFKEGAATWSEALWMREKNADTNAYYKYMKDNIGSRYIDYADKSIFNIPIYGNPPELIFTAKYVPLTYHKASWVYHQLMILLGEELHFQLLKELLEEYKFKNIDAEIFCSFFKEKTKDLELDVPLSKFFEQWLYKAGHPTYNTSTNITIMTAETMRADIVLEQTQTGSNISEVFETPIDILFCKGPMEEVVHRERVLNNKRVQEFMFENIPNFDKAYIDRSRTLCENKKVNVSIIENAENNSFVVYPNPAVKSDFIYVSHSNLNIFNNILNNIFNNVLSISVYNSLGQKINTAITNLERSLQIDIRNLESGVYYIIANEKVLNFSVIK